MDKGTDCLDEDGEHKSKWTSLISTALPALKLFITYSLVLLYTTCIQGDTQGGEEGNIFMVGQRESSLELACGFTCSLYFLSYILFH